MHSQRTLSFGTLMVLLVCSAGCGSSSPQTIKVSGTVKFDGKPLTKGTISFLPTATGTELNRPANGVIDSNGHFELSTFQPGDGALPGKYQVAVVSNSNEPTVEEMAEKGAKIISAIPAGYNSPVTSGLSATVADEGKAVVIDFELKTGGAPDQAPEQGAGPAVDQFGT